MPPKLSPWLMPAFYGTIFLSAGATGFVYVACYRGYGHTQATALPMGFGLAAVMLLVTAMATGSMSERSTMITTAAIAAFWIVAAALMIAFA
jgi:hypothetical protein